MLWANDKEYHMSRYDELLELIDKYKPQSIVEIGVWNGANAIRMIKRAQRYNKVTYTGYDLFEDATEETDLKEFNVKGHNRVRAVAAYIAAETGVQPNLIKGDTNQTLQMGVEADFVFLDGGHSVGTIKHDYECVCLSKVVVLDDYYTDGPDTNKFGCNNLVYTFPHELGQIKDPVKGGGFTQLVVVER